MRLSPGSPHVPKFQYVFLSETCAELLWLNCTHTRSLGCLMHLKCYPTSQTTFLLQHLPVVPATDITAGESEVEVRGCWPWRAPSGKNSEHSSYRTSTVPDVAVGELNNCLGVDLRALTAGHLVICIRLHFFSRCHNRAALANIWGPDIIYIRPQPGHTFSLVPLAQEQRSSDTLRRIFSTQWGKKYIYKKYYFSLLIVSSLCTYLSLVCNF